MDVRSGIRQIIINYWNASDDFTDHPKVANGVSDMMVNIFGDAGKHVRFAVGVSSLPFGAAVEN
jgi:enamine deaminase RidA (YjgF/YER057c/UK114 family)